jgi:hypothetical protein
MVGALLIIMASAATMTAAMTFESKIDGIIMDKKAALKKVDNEEEEAAEGEEAVVETISDADVVEIPDATSNVVEFTSDNEGNLKKDGNEVQTSFQPQPDQQPQQPDLDAIKVINFTDNRSSQN